MQSQACAASQLFRSYESNLKQVEEIALPSESVLGKMNHIEVFAVDCPAK